NDRHLLLGGGNYAVLGKLVKTGNNQLGSHEEQDHGRDLEELLQINAYAAFYEHHAKHHGGADSQQGAEKTDQFAGIQRHRGEDEHRLCALAQHHQKDERKQSQPGVLAGQQAHFVFNLALQLAAGFHHKNDHGDDKESRGQHHPAFENVFVEVGAGQKDSAADAAQEGRNQSGVDSLAELRAPDFDQVGEGDAYDQGRLDALSQGDNKGLQHARK